MKNFIRVVAIVFFLGGLSVPGNAQKKPAKFGKISMEHLEATLCPIDSNAHAYYIFDYGHSSFQYSKAANSFELIFSRHFRIKILDDQAFDWADISIPLYVGGSTEEKAGSIKAMTYNLENGKIVKSKMNNKDIYLEKSNDQWDIKKFAMPNVKEGSIIEVEYRVVSEYFFNLQEWRFQTTIPVLQSEYHVYIPEYYIYNQTQKGYFPFQTERRNSSKTISLTSVQRAETTGKTNMTNQNIQYNEQIFHYNARNIPAFPEEDYLRTKDNYMTKIEFELNRIEYPSSPAKHYNTTWAEVDDLLEDSEGFGIALKREGHLKEDAERLKSKAQGNVELLSEALKLIQDKVAWDNHYTKYVERSLARAYKDGQGNVAEVNLNLVALLRLLEFEAYPLVLSTQRNGIIHPSHPTISSFNYVIAMVRIGESDYLLDATDPNAGVNLLPVRCLNDKGRVIGLPGTEWVNLMDYKPYNYSSNYSLSFGEDLSLKGKRTLLLNDYAKYHRIRKIREYNSLQEYQEDLNDAMEEQSISNLQAEGLDSLGKTLTISYDLNQEAFIDDAEMFFFSPILNPFFESNPFKLEQREYPVEFDYPYTVQQNYNYLIPEGYTVEEIPKAMLLRMPDKSAQYTYQVVESGGYLMIYTRFQIRKSNFLPEEYEGLKQFYEAVINKQNELVLLTKS